jgi:glycosyltransferase involved in cell wall biosynthesis
MLSGDLKWGAFHAAEAFVLPSHQENFGIAVAEAMACGVPGAHFE